MPELPGVYIMKNEDGEIIYIGKAVNLKNRVRQYFQPQARQLPKVNAMVPKIKKFEYIVTDTEMEALILECNLIKKHRPKFNILLKDDKTYPYIKITMGEEYPRILITRRIVKDGSRYFGPYSNAGAVKDTVDLLKKLFPLKTCNRVLPRDIGKERPCLNFHIKQCLGPCKGDVDKEKYRAVMADICSFLEGRQEKIIERLEQQMREAAEEMEFEKAAFIRDKINSLKHVLEKQKIVSVNFEDMDVIAFAMEPGMACAQVFFVRGGKLLGREHYIFDQIEDGDSELITSFIKQFYSSAAFVPKEILISGEIEERELIEQWLSNKKGTRVYIKVPKRGEKFDLVKMVANNAAIELSRFKERVLSENKFAEEGLENLSKVLGLKTNPERIEAFDISNTGRTEMVASMVVFEKGMPAKKEYRRFKIKWVEGINDYGAMQEVIYRRFRNTEFNKMPDIILVDGGSGHVRSVKLVLDELNAQIPVAGMVKDEKHRTRSLVFQESEIDLSTNITLLRFISSVQNEAHRFALEYNKKLRAKRYRASELDDIKGIGEARKASLLKHFGSVSRIKEASIEELATVKGISKPLAQEIYDFFHKVNK
ncbi:MAG TPA: excinuclease ABC subunit UvrC [Clostridiaceae bacterium]|nr:excinuclease ABC subunit UvrC [Clostridiaceae bacterium]